ncbi:MAG: phenylalanine 4-monooxygenase [Gammaproteobacteria bacterium]
MSYKTTSYVAKQPDAQGYVTYDEDENSVWHELIVRQRKVIENRACEEYLQGVNTLNLSNDAIPQCNDISATLSTSTGWRVEPVSALIPATTFFDLLAQRKFPAATFIRRRDEMDYLQEPDIFHEIFGHCPLLNDPVYGDFMQKYGEVALKANKEERKYLLRLYWFTVEFGLIQTEKGQRCYGGGILSSKKETIYALESDIPERRPFNALDALRTPYRIDILQTIYYVIEDFSAIYQLMEGNIMELVHAAMALGEFQPTFPLSDDDTKPQHTDVSC